MKLVYILIILIGLCPNVLSQTITIHSIAAARESTGDTGYTLDGLRMKESRLKLLHTSNFGVGGTYDKNILIFDGYEKTGSLEEVSKISKDNIFFFGAFNQLNASTQEFTDAEIDSLYNWSKHGGKLIITSGGQYENLYDATMLNSKWEYTWTLNPSSIVPNVTGSSTDIFNGPFGQVISANQGALVQGHFTSIPLNSKILATDQEGNPTLFMDCNTQDLIIADVDAYTDLGGISPGNSISNSQDRFWANTIVFMDRLQPLPVITNNSGSLSLNSTYESYQWFQNGNPVSRESILNTTKKGTYYVEIEFYGGCKLSSDSFIISEIDQDKQINLFPNPSNSIIQVSGLTTEENFRIYNILGQVVLSGVVSNLEEIDITPIESGQYFLELNQACTIKFLKQ